MALPCKSSPGSSDERRTVPGGHRPLNQAARLEPKLAAVQGEGKKYPNTKFAKFVLEVCVSVNLAYAK